MLKKIKRLSYVQLIALGYLIIISIGTGLLLLPISKHTGMHADFVQTLFTATSATCVTGLVVFDTFTQWSLFGQIVILVLIQVGGLGFMTVITLFSFMFRRKIGLKERGLLRESISSMNIGGIVRLIKKILLVTFLFEGIGATLLAIRFTPKMGLMKGIYYGVFHAVSAFCNAGFDIMGKYGQYSSLTTFSGDKITVLTISILIIIGSIGFFIWEDLYRNNYRISRYRLHTKIVLTVTAILIVVGTVSFFLLEKDNTLVGLSLFDKFTNAFFCAVTPRTAGFNTVDTAKLNPASNILTTVLMFIGGSPGSTAGGIKTTTLAVILISAWSTLRNKQGDHIFKRRLEDDSLNRAIAVIVLNLSFIIIATILISASNNSIPVNEIMFETTSAIGTVGLTTGITRSLNEFAQVILIILMYTGRVGSLSFALLFTLRNAPAATQRPVERINIG